MTVTTIYAAAAVFWALFVLVAKGRPATLHGSLVSLACGLAWPLLIVFAVVLLWDFFAGNLDEWGDKAEEWGDE